MNSSATPQPTPGPDLESLVRQQVCIRLRFWALAIGIPLLLIFANLVFFAVLQFRRQNELVRELETLKSQTVQLGQPVELYNPAWGTVLDAVDYKIFPGRDGRDPRLGAMIQQYMPMGNDQQAWQLRPPTAERSLGSPLPVEAYVHHGFSFVRARDFNRAVIAFEYCLKHYPDSPEAHGGLAIALRDKGNFPSSLASHDRAIESVSSRPASSSARADRPQPHVESEEWDDQGFR